MDKSSYGLFDSSFMKLVCESYLKQYDKIFNDGREAAITKKMNRRFFAPKTREKAIKSLEESGLIFSEIGEGWLMGLDAMNQKRQVEQVLKLTEFNTQVYVSGELFTNMCKILPKELVLQS